MTTDSTRSQITIGFVGLGAMGSTIAARLLALGHQLYGTNRTPAKAAALLERGLVWRDTPREIADVADVIFSMVADDEALAAVTSGPDGILAGLRPGKVYVDMSTVGPKNSRELAERVRERGAEMIEAPVSGSVPAADAGTLSIMVGGPESVFAQVAPLLHELGSTVTRIGDNGTALFLKLAINISLAEQMIAFSEGVLLAERGGVDPALAVSVITGSAVGSPMLKSRGPFVLDQPERAWFDVRLMRKDLLLALEIADEIDLHMPSARVADQVYAASEQLGLGDRDIAVVHQVLSGMSRI
jgi:3-hydroxyisobutyrate dehydrogenase-like beta-hydroxyacid dehydrogenase